MPDGICVSFVHAGALFTWRKSQVFADHIKSKQAKIREEQKRLELYSLIADPMWL